MVDTSSPLLGLLLMGTGGDDNAWGANCNTQVFTPLENAIAGITSLSVTGGSHSLTSTEARSAVIILSGTLTADQTIVVPGTTKTWAISNQTSGNFYVIVKAGSGAGVNVPQGATKKIICTGTNTILREDAERVGEFFYHAGTTAPAGSFECNGATALRTSAIDLYAAIGTTWGPGDGFTTFTLPSAEDTGRFLRSKSGSFAVGTYQVNQLGAHTHTASTSAVTGTTDSQGLHSHTYADPGHIHANTPGIGANAGVNGPPGTGGPNFIQGDGIGHPTSNGTIGITINAAGAHTHNVSGTAAAQTIGSTGGSETRPESLVGLLCIRY